MAVQHTEQQTPNERIRPNEVRRRKLVSLPPFILLLTVEAMVLSGCTTPTTHEELDLTTYDPAQDHQKIAAHYSREAARFRQAAEQLSVRATLYQQLFGPMSDWVAGTRLLIQSYEEQAKELERKAREHLDLIHGPRIRSDPPVKPR